MQSTSDAQTLPAIVGSQLAHFRRLGLTPDVIASWEDGLRTNPGELSFEWWHFNCYLEDGSCVTVDFHTKPPFLSPRTPLSPLVSLTIDRPDGTSIQKLGIGRAEEFFASREQCDVRIGSNRFQGDLQRYEIDVSIDGVVLHATLNAVVPAFRPHTGHLFFGANEEHFIAWLPVVPRGDVSVRLSTGRGTEVLRGTGYHDHNWGNISLRKVVDHWYWGRARIGNFTVVVLALHVHQRYGKQALAGIMVAEGSEIRASQMEHVRFGEYEPTVSASGVPIAGRLVFEVELPHLHCGVTWLRKRDLFAIDFGEAGAYERCSGDVVLDYRAAGGHHTERAEAMWEQLYFGPRSPLAPRSK